MMTAVVDGVQVEGTPEEIHRFLNLRNQNYKECRKAAEEMRVMQIRLDTGEIKECNYHSEEEMFAETEANGEKVIEWWTCV